MTTMTNPSFTQAVFRGVNDDGSLTTATLIGGANNTNWSQQAGIFRCRFRVQQTDGGANQNLGRNFKLRCQTNGTGGFVDIAAQATGGVKIRYADSANFTDNAAIATGNFRLGAGTGTAIAGVADENADTGTITFTSGAQSYTELEFALELVSGQIVGGDTFELRVYETDNTALTAYTNTPTVTASVPQILTAEAGAYTYTGTAALLSKPPTPVAALNTNAGLETDTTYLIRVRVERGGSAGGTGFRWAYNHNGGGDTPLTTTSTHIKAVAAASFANDDDVREVLGGTGAYLVDNNAATEDGTTTLGAAFPASGAVEFVLAFQLDSANVSNGQTGTIRLELGDGTDLDTYDNTFTYTVGTGAALTAEAGAYTLTGTTATLRWDHRLAADAGAYTLTGTDAGLFKGSGLAAEAGVYTYTGQDAALLWNHRLTAEAGAYTYTGETAGLFWNHLLRAVGAAEEWSDATLWSDGTGWLGYGEPYTLTGQAATLTWNQGAIILTAESGSYVLTGQDATLIGPGETLTAEAGTYALTGTDAALLRNHYLAAGLGGYILSGTAATLLWNHVLAAETGPYALTGQDATLTRRVSLTAETGSYTLSGTDATLDWQRRLVADPGAYALSGQNATLLATGETPPGGGSFLLDRRRRR